MSQSYFLPKIVNYDKEKSSLFVSEVVENKGEFSIQAALLAKELPSYAKRFKEKCGYRSFHSNEYVDEHGDLTSESGENTISLINMAAFWYPDQVSLFRNLLKNYHKASRESDTADADSHAVDYDPAVTKSAEPSADPKTEMQSARQIDIQQLAEMMMIRKSLLFTGAGISMSQGMPNLDQLVELIQEIFFPEDELFRGILTGATSRRIEKIQEYNRLIFNTSPSKSHWVISEICKTYFIPLVTGNFDGLHEKTGIKPVFQNSEKVVIPDLEKYEMLVTVGLGDEGIGQVANVFRQKSANAVIVAINTSKPDYLGENDYFILCHSDEILNQLLAHIRRISKTL